MHTLTKALSCSVAAALLLTGCWPVPPPDDAGAAAFYEQFLPLVLGRRVRNAQERNYLLDLEALYGRQVVMDLLMEEPEYVATWKNNLLRDLQLQRDGNRGQSAQCFGEPMRFAGGGDSGELATFIRDNPVTSNYPGTNVFADPDAEAIADDPINMTDVVESALRSDDLSVVYKAYMVPLIVADGLLGAEEVGKAFNRAFLNRNLECSECHNIETQLLIKPIQIDLELQVFGCGKCAGNGIDQSEIWSVFRQDVTGDDAPAGQSTIRPWGLHPSCGTVATDFTEGSQPTVFAGLNGGFMGLTHLVDQFSAGVESIRSGGLSFSGGTIPGNQELPPAQSLVYMVSAKIVEDVWEDLVGSPLTEAHYFAKNEDQRDMQRFLTESFIGSDWSLKELISLIMVTGYANRRAPAQSTQASPSVLAPIFEAFAGPANGQGDLVFRYPPHSLFSQLRGSLGWPKWNAFPDEDAYPSLELNRDLEQYLSDSSAGARDWGFQSLLAWEAAVATCENPGNGSDWIDRLLQSVEDFDDDHPDDPITVRDVVRTVKDRLIGDARISNGPGVVIDDYENDDGGICCAPEPPDDYANPDGGGDGPGDLAPLPPLDAETELEGLEAMFGTALHNPTSSVSELELKVRRFCGTLLKSPQRTLSGIVDREALMDPVVPRLLVGNAGEPATYQQICESYRPGLAALGRDVSCGPGGVSETPGITIEPNPHDAARREDAAKRVRSFLASIEGQSQRASFRDPRSGGPIPEEDLEMLLDWAQSLPPEELVEKLPSALLHGAPPDAESYDRMLQEARRTLERCESDADGDGICDTVDPCLFYPNRLPLVDTNRDGLPDECQCGDGNGSGSYETADVKIASDCAATDPAAARIQSCILGIARGDANGSGRFERDDSLLIDAVLRGTAPAHSLRCALRPEGTKPGAARR